MKPKAKGATVVEIRSLKQTEALPPHGAAWILIEKKGDVWFIRGQTKDASAEQIEAAIRAVHRGQTWLDPVVQARLVSALGDAVPDESARPLPGNLTAREVEVLTLIGEGLSNREIGERLVLGQATVKTHVNRIFAKTGVQSRAQAVRYAISNGLAGA